MNTNMHKVGLVLGALLGGMHLVWSLLVFFGYAQPLVNFILWAHMVSIPYMVGPFDFTAAVILVAVTSAIGYVVGCVTSVVWDKVHG